MSHRSEKYSSTLKHCLADIFINEVEDRVLKSIAILDVQVSSDLKKAAVTVAPLDESSTDLVSRLDRAKGFIRTCLARKMYSRYVPELTFIAQKSGADPAEVDEHVR